MNNFYQDLVMVLAQIGDQLGAPAIAYSSGIAQIDVIIQLARIKDAVISGGAVLPSRIQNIVNLTAAITDTILALKSDGSVTNLGVNVASGIVQLDNTSKIPLELMPNGISGGLNQLAGLTWNASTNTPTLASGALYTGSPTDDGDFLVVSTSGSTTLDGISTWVAGDLVLSAAGAWKRITSGGAGVTSIVTAIGTYSGTVNLTPASITTRLGQFQALATLIGSNGAIILNSNNTLSVAAIGSAQGLAVYDSFGRIPLANSQTLSALGGITQAQGDARYFRILNLFSEIVTSENKLTAQTNLGGPFLSESGLNAHNLDPSAHPVFSEFIEGVSGLTAGLIGKNISGTYLNFVLQGSTGQITATADNTLGTITLSLTTIMAAQTVYPVDSSFAVNTKGQITSVTARGQITASTTQTISAIFATIKCTNSSAINLTLPAPNVNLDLIIRCTNANVTLIAPSGQFEQFTGETELILMKDDVAHIKSDGVDYYL